MILIKRKCRENFTKPVLLSIKQCRQSELYGWRNQSSSPKIERLLVLSDPHLHYYMMWIPSLTRYLHHHLSLSSYLSPPFNSLPQISP
ncbi:hypothetical protein P8452_77907 [Trifolium repens]|nr:hypothetical protein P8452_77907 [Trifolium repens]